MGVTISADGLSIVHQGSGGEANASVPDVCLTTVGKPVVPIPYGNHAKSADLADGTTTVTADGGNSIALKNSIFSSSTGDAGGDQKGLVSGTTEAEAKFTSASSTVKIEGVGVARKTDMMTMNAGNTVCFGCENPSVTVQPDEDQTHALRIHCRYSTGYPLADAPFKLKDESGAVLAEGTLNGQGEAIVDGLPTQGCTVEYGEAPAPFTVNYLRSVNPNQATLPDDIFFDRASERCVPFWIPRGDMQKQSWGYVGEVLTDSMDIRQMLEVEIRAALPLNPKPGQVEDIAARLMNFFEQQTVPEQEVLGLISTLMPVLDKEGVLFELFVKYHKEESGQNLLASMRYIGRGNPQAWLDQLDWDAKSTELSRACVRILEQTDKRLETVSLHADTRGYSLITDNLKAHRDAIKTVRRSLPDDVSAAMKGLKQKITTIRAKGEAPMVVLSQQQRTTQGSSINDVVHALKAMPAPLAINLTYDDIERTPAGYVPYTVMFANGETHEGKLDAKGSVVLYGVPQVGAQIEFGDEGEAKKAETAIPDLIKQIPEQMAPLLKEMVNIARREAATMPVTEVEPELFALVQASVEAELAEMEHRKDAFDDLSFLEQSWRYAQHAGLGVSTGVTDYIPDFGEFGELMDAADIGVDVLVEAIATGDIDILQRRLDQIDRAKLGLQQASMAMEILLLLLSEPETREYLASLPRRLMQAMPPDEFTRFAVSQITQKGIDTAAVTGGTALAGAASAGVAAPVAAAAITGGVTARNAGKGLEGLIEVLMKIAENKKLMLNHHKKKQHETENETNLERHKGKPCGLCGKKVLFKGRKAQKTKNLCKHDGYQGELFKATDPNYGFTRRGFTGKGSDKEQRKHSPWKYLGIKAIDHDWWARCADKNKHGKWRRKEHEQEYPGNVIAAHHIVTIEEMKKNDFLFNLLPKLGYNINKEYNVTVLPIVPELACALEVPLHNSSHPSAYTIEINRKLLMLSDEIEDSFYCYQKNAAKDMIINRLYNISVDMLQLMNDFSHKGIISQPASFGADYAQGNAGCRGKLKEGDKKKSKEQQCNHRFGASHHQFLDFYNNIKLLNSGAKAKLGG
ncbi:PAAR-like domain-containing protein [Photobacterium sp. 1_MG-2023]|uniref:PAAR-like domain-containing protein n=1 Tax=Photobacterium sp. 1_MG-2023 TaxID=3062646 RepID=UPI0026E2CC20|nr:PAAR-like domain-containing protein [Photobacterium sp. 1_MG-2023]MDO6707526.1 DUF4150 domain-containing protein [Photobacterium sp. 1_MG-2023]